MAYKTRTFQPTFGYVMSFALMTLIMFIVNIITSSQPKLLTCVALGSAVIMFFMGRFAWKAFVAVVLASSQSKMMLGWQPDTERLVLNTLTAALIAWVIGGIIGAILRWLLTPRDMPSYPKA